MIHDLSKKTDGTDIIADIIETELSSMDKAIEEAALSIEVSVLGIFKTDFVYSRSCTTYSEPAVPIAGVRLWNQAGSERENTRRVHGTDEQHPDLGAEIEILAG